jgi:hypothetical protein
MATERVVETMRMTERTTTYVEEDDVWVTNSGQAHAQASLHATRERSYRRTRDIQQIHLFVTNSDDYTVTNQRAHTHVDQAHTPLPAES